MKKIILSLLSATILLCTSLLTANSASQSTEAASVDEYRFDQILETTLPKNTLESYTYGITTENNPGTSAVFTNDKTGKEYSFDLADCIKGTQTIKLEEGQYEALICNGGNGYKRYNFENTNATYILTKFKLCDFDEYFNNDGTRTQQYEDGYTHNFNFANEKDGNSSQLVILSGGYVNFVAPDENGYVQAYICQKCGIDTYFMTDFCSVNGAIGGGISYKCIYGLVIGNANLSSSISVDDVTAVQKYSAELEEFNKLQMRNADVNFDGKVDIDDATMIQKYLAGLV